MAKCDQGYLCQICGEEVKTISQSSLYLRYVIGQIPSEVLHTHPERHIRCDAEIAQFIVDENFEPVLVDGGFDKRLLDPEDIREHEQLVTRGWHRLRELVKQRPSRITDYPLPEIRQRMQADVDNDNVR